MRNAFKLLTLCLAMILTVQAYAQTYNKQQQCKDKLLNELKDVMSQDNGLIQAQLMITSMKLAQKVLKRHGLREQSIESYIQDIVGEKTIGRLEQRSDIQNDILGIYNKYSGEKKYLDAKADLEGLKSANVKEMSDEQIARYMIQMQTIWKEKDDFGFNAKDYSMAWFVNTVNKNVTGNDSYFISRAVKGVLGDINNADRSISKNIARAYLQLKARLQKLKMNVFAKHKELCVNLYDPDDNPNAQNESIFENISCDINENKLLDSLFEESIEDIFAGLDAPSFEPANLRIRVEKEKTPAQIRQVQDIVNSKLTDKEKIVEYYKYGMQPKEPKCDGFLIVDKKNFTTTLYTTDGEEVMTSPTILGQGRTINFAGKDLEFNPDSKLRRWDHNGKKVYSKTTGAGTYWVKKNLTHEERTKTKEEGGRDYQREFNDRVLVIYSPFDGNEDGQKEEIQAIHGVPNPGKWTSNRHSRMKSFEDKTKLRKLSTGCVNLEGYTYDMMEEFVGHKCPIYILPEDKDNYYHMKNGEILFSTGIADRKFGKEKASDGKNVNIYNYNPRSKSVNISGYNTDKLNSSVLDQVFQDFQELRKRAPHMENDDFQDYAALTHALTQDTVKAKQIFLDLYTSAFRLKDKADKNQRARFEQATMEKRRMMILESYQKEFGVSVNKNTILNKAKEVEFVK
jgi:hypothetical protein